VRFRPHFFPFTEPSVELDVDCFNCNGGFLRDGSRCHALQGRGLDRAARRRRGRPERVRVRARVRLRPRAPPGLRLGHGDRADRGLKYGVPDIRLLYDNDLRFLEQFG
jgi:phenylalanyl-tRNA synthetase alpha chain